MKIRCMPLIMRLTLSAVLALALLPWAVIWRW